MKTINFKTILAIFILLVSTVCCKAQQTYSLNADYENIPDYSYLKDLNNELPPYVGTYKANFQGNEITLFIERIEHKLEKSNHKNYYQDVLSIKYIVKNTNGYILQDTKNMNFSNDQILFTIYSMGTRPSQNIVSLYYGGTNCGIGWGKILLKKLNSTQISWEYLPNDTVIDSNKCPNGTNTTIYLPETKDLIFTKQ